MDQPRKLYDETATRWVRTQPLSLSDFTGRPPVLALCQPVAGARVLDLGCGEGYCARQLRQMGAADVLGIDLSAAMIEAARAQEAAAPLGLRYRQGDLCHPEALSDLTEATFDLVLSMFMFNYLTTADMTLVLRQARRVLRAGGRLIFAVPHPGLPFMRAPAPPFYFDVQGPGYFSRRDQRFPGRIWKRDGSQLEVQLVHKTLGDYFTALRAAGFTALPTVQELSVTPEILAVDPDFFGPLVDVPLHLALAVPAP